MKIDKKLVSAKLRKMVACGKIKKPNQCDRCGGVFEKRKIAGHHLDYNKPFEVKWLCPDCHDFIERQAGNRIKFQKGHKQYNLSGRGWFKKGYDSRRTDGQHPNSKKTRFKKGSNVNPKSTP